MNEDHKKHMKLFNTPEEAIAETEAAFEKQWANFSAINNIKPEVNKEAYELTKKVFRAGYMFGAQFISGKLIETINSTTQENEHSNANQI